MSKLDLEVNDLNQEESVIEDTPKKKKHDLMSGVLVFIGVICVGVALHGLYGIYKDYKEGQDIYNEVKEEFVHVNIPESEDGNTTENGSSENTEKENIEPDIPKGPWYERVSVDLEGLQNKYEEVVGWIFFENEDISYPILQGDDNEKYLTTAYNGAHSNVGSIFLDVTNKEDFSDTHTIVYGHNLHDLTMFSRLKYYKTKSGYYQTHKYFQIFSGNEILRYEIFAYQDVSIDSFIYRERFYSAKEVSERLLETSMINPGIHIEDDDRVITLSTCTTDKAYRMIVSAVLVERYNLTDKILIEE